MQIRGEAITAKVPVLVCTTCHDVQPDGTAGADTMRPFYDAYRKKHHLLAPAEIAAVREKHGLSREAFAALLGMSPATLYRYESGALQDDVHDVLFVLCQSVKNMRELVARRKGRLSALRLRRFEEASVRRPMKGVSAGHGRLRRRKALGAVQSPG